MKNKQKVKKSVVTIDIIDKINLMKVDISFMSNLLIAWDISQAEPTYNDMSGMSRVCDTIHTQLNECQELVNTLRQNS